MSLLLALADASAGGVRVYWIEATASNNQTLFPPSYANTNSFFAASVTTGSVALTPARFDNANTFFGGSVSQTAPSQTLTAARFDNTSTFNTHTLTRGAVTLTAARFDNTNSFFGGTVSLGGAAQTLTASLFVNRPNASPFTKTLLNLNGTNGSTTIVDDSPAPHTFTAQGSAVLSTAQIKFGSASLSVGGLSWVQTTTGLDDYRFGTGDFVVEAQIYPTVLGSNGRVVVDFYASTGNGWQVFITPAGKLQWWRSSLMIVESASTIAVNTWTHILASRSGGTTRVFINGVLEGSATDSTNYTGTSINTMAVGAQVHARNTSYDFNGYIDDVRIQGGVGVSSAFTAPTSELENPFFGATITVGAVTLSALRLDNTQTFYSHLLTNASPSQTLTATRFDNTSTIYSASLAASIALFPTLLSNVNDFYAHVIGTSAATLSVPLVVNTNEFYGGVVFRTGLSSDYNANRVVYVPAENTSYGAALSIARTVFVTEAATPTTAVVSQNRTAYVPAEYV